MPKAKPKSLLPSKSCVTCDRPFTWRKVWAKDWDSVKYCSDRCRRVARQNTQPIERISASSDFHGQDGGIER
jgi:hypothetical protein